jgi:SET domain-containing protein
VFIRTLRAIRAGEEITYDYGVDYLKNVIGRSNCKCGRCMRRRARKARERRALDKRRQARQRAKRRRK